MSARVEAGPAGVVLASLVDHLVEACRRDPWRPHTVLVPSARAAAILALRVAERGGAFGLDALTPRALAGRLRAPDAPEPLSAAARAVLMRRAATDQSGEADASASRGESLIALRDTLAAAAVPLAAALEFLAPDQAAALERFDALCAPHPQPAEVLGEAARRLVRGEARAPAHLDAWGFAGLTRQEERLIAALAARSELTLYVATAPPGAQPPPARRRLWRAVGASAADGAVEPTADPGALAVVELVAAANAAAEADAAARVAAAWARDAVAPHRLVVVGPEVALARVAARLGALGLTVRARPAPLAVGAPCAYLGRLAEVWADGGVDALSALLAGPCAPVMAADVALLAERVLALGGGDARTRLAAAAETDDAGPDAEAVAETAILVRQRLQRLDAARTWAEVARALGEALDEWLGDAGGGADDGVRAAVAHLARLDGLEGAGPPDAAAVRSALGAELAAADAFPTPAAAPVELCGWTEAALAHGDAVVLLGVAAEDLAATALAAPLSEEARARLGERGFVLDGPEAPALERQFAAALARAASGRVAALYVGHGRTGPRPPAEVLRPWREGVLPEVPLDAVDSRRRLWTARSLADGALAALAVGDGPLAHVARWQLAARSADATAYDGQVRLGAWREPPGGWSATTLEAYGRCPYADFLERVLRVPGGRPPDALGDAEPARDVAGRLAHAALERLRRRARAEGREPLTAGDLPWARAVLAEALAAAFAEAPAGPLAPVQREALLADLAHAVALDVQSEDLITLDSEWRFGPDGAAPLRLDLGDGASALLRGRVDRVAEGRPGPAAGAAGETGASRPPLWVIDYKTGQRLPAVEPAADALQLPLYMIAVADAWRRDLAQVRGLVVSVTARGGFRRRTLDGGDLASRLDELRRLVRQALAGMRTGAHGPRPAGGKHCPSCPFRPACPADIAARAARKGLDTADGTDEAAVGEEPA